MQIVGAPVVLSAPNPVVFISYAHADAPDKSAKGEVQRLSFVRQYLRAASEKDGVFEVRVDRQMMGGANWDRELEGMLRRCAVFIPLDSMASSYFVDKKIPIIRERQAYGDDVYSYRLPLVPTPDAGLDGASDEYLSSRSHPLHD